MSDLHCRRGSRTSGPCQEDDTTRILCLAASDFGRSVRGAKAAAAYKGW